MKNLFSFLIVLGFTLGTFSQAPDKLSYQAVIRNASGALVTNYSVGIRISILQGSPTGTVVYSELFNPNPKTNANGLVTIEIGGGVPLTGSFSTINWASGTYFLKIETDPTGGTDYTIVGTSQLLSVPYALYAKKSGDGFSGNYNDLYNKPILFDGAWTSLSGKPNLAAVASSGLFNDLLLKPTTLSGYGITNAMSTVHPANAINSANISNWNIAYGWGDHSISGYFKNGGEIGGSNRTIGNTDNYALSLITNNIGRLFIGSNGKIGIGTNSPENALTIVGDETAFPGRYLLSIYNTSTSSHSLAYFSAKAGSSGNITILGHISETYTANASPEDVQDYGIVHSNGEGLILAAVKSIDEPGGIIKFVTGLSSPDIFNERMRIDASGNIGIGTKEPKTKLDVNGIITTNGGTSENWNFAFEWGDHEGLYRPSTYVPAWSEITNKPTTLTGYGITDGISTSNIIKGIIDGNERTILIGEGFTFLFIESGHYKVAFLNPFTNIPVVTATDYGSGNFIVGTVSTKDYIEVWTRLHNGVLSDAKFSFIAIGN